MLTDPKDAALIGLWVRADWRAWDSIITGTPVKPECIGGTIGGPWRDHPANPELAILGHTSWTADRTSIYCGQRGRNRQGLELPTGPASGHECSWATVSKWLSGFTAAERGEVRRVHRVHASAYHQRPEEGGYSLCFDSETLMAHAALYQARMRDGAWLAMSGCRQRFLEIVGAHLTPDVEAALFPLVGAA